MRHSLGARRSSLTAQPAIGGPAELALQAGLRFGPPDACYGDSSAGRRRTLLQSHFKRLQGFVATTAFGAALITAQPLDLGFVDVTSNSGLEAFDGLQGSVTKEHIIEVMGGGAAFVDYNADGYLDILLVRGSTIEQFERGGDLMCALYRGSGQGTFEDVTGEAGLTARGWGQGVALGDFDGDGKTDFFLTGYGSNALHRNLRHGPFQEVARRPRRRVSR